MDEFLRALTSEEQAALTWNWRFWARPSQIPPDGDAWKYWLKLGGRGSGKTRTGAEWIKEIERFVAREVSAGRFDMNVMGRAALVGPTFKHVRDKMIDGESGINSISDPARRPSYNSQKQVLTYPSGFRAYAYSDENPDAIDGGQHAWAWVDEAGVFRNATRTWRTLRATMRLGRNPRYVITVTPKKSHPDAKDELKRIRDDARTVVTIEHTDANRHNLSPDFILEIDSMYQGTDLARQELAGEILDDVEGAALTQVQINATRIWNPEDVPGDLVYGVGVDPAVTTGANADDTGIVVVGVDPEFHATRGRNGHVYVSGDFTQHRAGAQQWASVAVDAYWWYGAAWVHCETNQGGDHVKDAISNIDPNVTCSGEHTSLNKFARWCGVAMLWEQGRAHVVGTLPDLEEEMTTFTPLWKRSPNRVDAMVHAVRKFREGGLWRRPAPTIFQENLQRYARGGAFSSSVIGHVTGA